ncbi:MAG TPA: spore coat protein U domain-containing protein [Gammaproteobacteria bacterium]|nr:spore coat protein U domain-containing protein [Gammaproteobacteria bacterium]
MKQFSTSFLVLLGLLVALSFVPRAAWAPPSNCPGATVTATALSFGSYDSVAGSAVTSTATITVTCGGGNADPIISVQLNAGLNSAGSFNPRVLKNTAATDTLNYNLYTAATYIAANIWGDGTGGTLDPGGTTGGVNGANTLVQTVFGQIPASQDPTGVCPSTPCTYNDTVTITVNF